VSALDKFFLSAGARDISLGRQKALQAVRELVAGKGNTRFIGSGIAAEAFKVGDKVVKRPDTLNAGDKLGQLKEFKRRGFLDGLLGDIHSAPNTHLVETSGNKYLVQDALETPHMDVPESRYMPKAHEDAEDLREFLYSKGFGTRDVRAGNVGYDAAGTTKLFDSGHLLYPGPMPPKGTKPMSEAQRQKALEKFISIGKRKKPWLEK
jgi:hypothetical protein